MNAARLIELLSKVPPELEVFGCYDSFVCQCTLKDSDILLIDDKRWNEEKRDYEIVPSVFLACGMGDEESIDYYLGNGDVPAYEPLIGKKIKDL